MVQGNFYFIKNDYFNKFLNENLSNNKSQVSGTADRPCIFAFEDKENSGLLWCVPISSKVSKYEKIYQDKMQSLGKCYTLEFGKILGSKRAFLIQNMFPITDKYILNEYQKNGISVRTDNATTNKVIDKAKKVLALEKKGIHIIFTDILKIQNELLKELASSEVATTQTATSVGQQQNPAPTNVQKAVDNVTLVEIEPLDVYKNVSGGGVIVKLSGKNPEDAKRQVLLQENEFLLDKYNKVCSVSALAQARFGIPLKNNTIKKLTT